MATEEEKATLWIVFVVSFMLGTMAKLVWMYRRWRRRMRARRNDPIEPDVAEAVTPRAPAGRGVPGLRGGKSS